MIYRPDYPSTSFQIESHLCDSLLLYIIIAHLLHGSFPTLGVERGFYSSLPNLLMLPKSEAPQRCRCFFGKRKEKENRILEVYINRACYRSTVSLHTCSIYSGRPIPAKWRPLASCRLDLLRRLYYCERWGICSFASSMLIGLCN